MGAHQVTKQEALEGVPARMSEESLRKRLLQTCAVILEVPPAKAPALLERMAKSGGNPMLAGAAANPNFPKSRR